jgi:hypothetical protein
MSTALPALVCPRCARTFLIGPDFVMDIASTGRIRPDGKRAEVRCGVCQHAWWSKHPDALRKARAARRQARPGPASAR